MQIDMKQLRSMDIARDGKSAWFQGGAYAYEVIPFLWDRGYVTSEHTSPFISLPCEVLIIALCRYRLEPVRRPHGPCFGWRLCEAQDTILVSLQT